MNVLYPKIPRALLPAMLGYAALGGLLAGMYGVLHDQVTYIHNAGYLGGLIGLIAAILYVQRVKRADPSARGE